MKKKFKGVLSMIIIACLLSGMSINAFATSSSNQPDGFEHSNESGNIILTPEVNNLSEYDKETAGLKSYSKYRATINSYGYNSAGTSKTIYNSAGTSVGTIDPRERVYVISSTSDNKYYVKFIYYGAAKYGYINASYIAIPPYGFERPIKIGKISQQYSGASGHTGIDVAPTNNVALYAIQNGTYDFRTWTANINGSQMQVNFANWVSTKFNDTSGTSIQALYAHMDSFTNGFAASTLTSYRQLYSGSTSSTSIGTKYLSAGSVIGYAGNTGYSTGVHLHFETRYSNSISTKRDPFLYVVFPGEGYDSYFYQ